MRWNDRREERFYCPACDTLESDPVCWVCDEPNQVASHRTIEALRDREEAEALRDREEAEALRAEELHSRGNQ